MNVSPQKTSSTACLAMFAIVGIHCALAQNATTQPVGAVTVTIAAASSSGRVYTPISIPLSDSQEIQGRRTGRISSFTSNSITCSDAGWSPGALSQASAPFLLRITSGQAEGATYLISSSTPNTATTVTLDSSDLGRMPLTNIGIIAGESGDTFEILPCETISSFFGNPPSSGIRGDSTASTADVITVTLGDGSVANYYYNTSLGRWARQALGNPDATNVPLRPDYGIIYGRVLTSPLQLTVTGTVPSSKRFVAIKNSGVTRLASYWPIPRTLSDLNLNSISNWRSNTIASQADTVTIGSFSYFHDGINWRRRALGSPIENPIINPGTSISVSRIGSNSTFDVLQQNVPYSLQ